MTVGKYFHWYLENLRKKHLPTQVEKQVTAAYEFHYHVQIHRVLQ